MKIIYCPLYLACVIFGISLNAQSSSLKNWIDSYNASPGTDGYLTIVYPNDQYVVQPGETIVYVNGMLNSYNDGINGARSIARSFNQPVVHVYSSSDLQNVGVIDLFFGNTAGNVVDGAVDAKNAVFSHLGGTSTATNSLGSLIAHELNSGQSINVIAHSRGAAITYNAINQLYSDQPSVIDFNNSLYNVSITTLGGFSPPAELWPNSEVVSDYNNGYDLVGKLLREDISFDDFMNFFSDVEGSHSLESYQDDIKNAADFWKERQERRKRQEEIEEELELLENEISYDEILLDEMQQVFREIDQRELKNEEDEFQSISSEFTYNPRQGMANIGENFATHPMNGETVSKAIVSPMRVELSGSNMSMNYTIETILYPTTINCQIYSSGRRIEKVECAGIVVEGQRSSMTCKSSYIVEEKQTVQFKQDCFYGIEGHQLFVDMVNALNKNVSSEYTMEAEILDGGRFKVTTSGGTFVYDPIR